MVCDDAPREVRFRCGHASCCLGCVAKLRARAEVQAGEAADERLQPPAREAAANQGVALCPVCCEPIGDEMAEVGARLGSAPTFVLQVQQPGGRGQGEQAGAAGEASRGRVGRGNRRGGRGGRGLS